MQHDGEHSNQDVGVLHIPSYMLTNNLDMKSNSEPRDIALGNHAQSPSRTVPRDIALGSHTQSPSRTASRDIALGSHTQSPSRTAPRDTAHGNYAQSPSRYTDDEGDIVVFNIGGEIFETLRETLQRDNISALSNEEFLRQHYRPRAGGYFFDRDPDIFRVSIVRPFFRLHYRPRAR